MTTAPPRDQNSDSSARRAGLHPYSLVLLGALVGLVTNAALDTLLDLPTLLRWLIAGALAGLVGWVLDLRRGAGRGSGAGEEEPHQMEEHGRGEGQ